jgi:hypothetical protein
MTDNLDSAIQAHTSQQKPTPAKEWGKVHAYLLPSGNIARLKRPSVLALASNGHNPVSMAVMLELYSKKDQPQTDDEKLVQIKATSRKYLEVLALTFVEPKLVIDKEPNYDNGEIGPADLDDGDLMWVYWTFIEGVAAQFAAFRIPG